ncbi:MAG TPA: ornithine cyclodeaminase family protein [Gemmatimonadales bacterium]|nr:ornithine cyclodeaminase family protein [Gemmatimonadales bacterium]
MIGRASAATRILARHEVAAYLSLDECIAAVEDAFRLHSEGRALGPGVLGLHAAEGGFHIKAAGLPLARNYFAAKLNANFSGNPARHGLPAIQGVVVLADADTGEMLALMDSIEITVLRTGAATAVAARRLARPESAVLTVVGCGNQGRVQVRALARVLPVRTVHAVDQDGDRASAFASELGAELSIDIRVAPSLSDAARASDVIVTCTPSRRPMLRAGDVRPGTFIAAVGADSEDKQELEPALLAHGAVVTDVLEQCATIGELHHALAAGVMTRADVRGDLGDVVSGRRPGRTSPEEITIFDSTGSALQDVAAAAVVYERAVASGRGLSVQLGA